MFFCHILCCSCIGRTSEHISSGRFFAYRVRIENRNDPDTSDTTVQLLGRHWNIYDDRKNILNRVDAPTTGAGMLYIYLPLLYFKMIDVF